MRPVNTLLPLCLVTLLALPGMTAAQSYKNHAPQPNGCQQISCARQAHETTPGSKEHKEVSARLQPRAPQPNPATRPGQSAQNHPQFAHHVGEHVVRGYTPIHTPQRYGLDPSRTYYQIGNGIYQVNRQTSEILGVIGLASIILR